MLPRPAIPLACQKLDYFEANTDRFDTVFVGSSRVYRQISPAVFDDTTAASGHPTSSLNLGADGMHGFEVLFFVKQIAAAQSDRLKYVLIDFEGARTDIHDENVLSTRVITWHDPGTTWLACRAVLGSDAPLGEKIRGLGKHLAPFSRNFTNFGRAGDWIEFTLAPPPQFAARAQQRLGRSGDGFYPQDYQLDDAHGATRDRLEKMRADMLADTALLQRRIDYVIGENEKPGEANQQTTRLMSRICQAVEQAGAVPIFITGPVLLPRHEVRFGCATVGADLIEFNDPNRYPRLYDLDLRFNLHHLNSDGARLYSELLARRFVESRTGDAEAAP